MDGKFVDNITYTPEQLKNIAVKADAIIEVHLMVINPIEQAEKYAEAGADIITFHFEAVVDVLSTIKQIKKMGTKVGISLKPSTDIDVII